MKKEDGYTLVEMSVAVLLSSLVAVLAYSSFLLGNRLFHRWEDETRTSGAVHIAMRRISTDIREAEYIHAGSDAWSMHQSAKDSVRYDTGPGGLLRNGSVMIGQELVSATLNRSDACTESVVPDSLSPVCIELKIVAATARDTIRTSTVVWARNISGWRSQNPGIDRSAGFNK